METIVAGSYDRFLFGFEFSSKTSEVLLLAKSVILMYYARTWRVRVLEKASVSKALLVQDSTLLRKLTYPAHKGPIKCIAAAAPFLASGGADDLIHLYNIQAGTDLGFLMSPGDGAVSALTFFCPDITKEPTHMLSGAADGTISIWRAGADWISLKTLQGHKKEVYSISVHPSGRLALSTSLDSSLRLWNLVKGKMAYSTKLERPADQVTFIQDGASYCLLCGPQVAICSIDGDGGPKESLTHPKKVTSLAALGSDTLLTGCEDGSIRVWDCRTSQDPVSLRNNAHAGRIRGVSPFSTTDHSQDSRNFASASSDGILRVWDLRKMAAGKCLAETSTNARLTCLTCLEPNSAGTTSKRAARKERQKQASLLVPAEVEETAKKMRDSKQKVTSTKGKAPEGIAHNGVVDFPDTKSKNKRRKQNKQM